MNPVQSRLDAVFQARKQQGRPALIVYVTAGYPHLDLTRRVLPELVAAGADVVELGMPFSDPVADGPTIQRAAQVALERGTRLADVLGLVGDLRREGFGAPVLLLAYANTLLAGGLLADPMPLVQHGFDGLIVPDLPSVESASFEALCRRVGLHWIPLLAPTSRPEHIEVVAGQSGGFIYCVSVTGVTGARETLPPSTVELLRRVRARARRPVAVGFGVAGPEQARQLAAFADGVIVGSALVERLAVAESACAEGRLGHEEEQAIGAAVSFVRALREALDD